MLKTICAVIVGFSGVLSAEVFEWRTYETHEGKMGDLENRFKNHTMALFEKHGIKNVGYWMTEDGKLTYLVKHESKEQAEKNWDAFRKDEDWQKAFKASRENGPIVKKITSEFLEAVEWSPMK